MNKYFKKFAKIFLPIFIICSIIFISLFCITKYTYNKVENKFTSYDITFTSDTEFSWDGIVFKNATLTFPNKSNRTIINKIVIRNTEEIDISGVSIIGDVNYLLSFFDKHKKIDSKKIDDIKSNGKLLINVKDIFGKLSYNNTEFIFKNCEYSQSMFKNISSCIVTSNVVDFELNSFHIDSNNVHFKNVYIKNIPQSEITTAIVTDKYHVSIPLKYIDFYRKILKNNKVGDNSFSIHIDFGRYNDIILQNAFLSLGFNAAIISFKKLLYNNVVLNNINAIFYDDTKIIHFKILFELSLKHDLLSNEEINFGKIKVDGNYISSTDALKLEIFKDKLYFLINFWQDGFVIQNSSFTTCQDFIDELPAQFKPIIGPYADQKETLGYFRFNIYGKSLDDFQVELNNQCHFNHKVGENELHYKIDHSYTNEYGTFGQGTADWVPLNLISHYVEKTVVFNEDAGFWQHNGFSNISIRDSIRENIKAGKFVRGASTISMQLAKNLYLNRDKNLARKIEEIFLTSHLEHNLSKHQIMELYLNIVQFGPNIYGIKQASKYYFNTIPMELSLRQSMFLSLLLPNPKAKMLVDGIATPATVEKITRLLKLMEKRGYVSHDEIVGGENETWCNCIIE